MRPRRESWVTQSARLLLLLAAAGLILADEVSSQPAPAGEAVIARHVTIAPTWFDPSTAPPPITPLRILYALHHGLVRPPPGPKNGHNLAEAWTESPDGTMYE